MDVVGVPPDDFETLVAVMAHQRVKGEGVTRRQLAHFLGEPHAQVHWLLRNHWLETDAPGVSPKQILKATSRAWNNLWPWRMGEPPAEQLKAG